MISMRLIGAAMMEAMAVRGRDLCRMTGRCGFGRRIRL